MLVIASDLHLTDGGSGQTIREGAFRVFRQRLRDLAYDASKRADGTYKPIEDIDIILLGDILDVIRSTTWFDGKVRPWDDMASLQQRDELFKRVDGITDAILKNNEDSFKLLKTIANGAITLPPQDPENSTKAKNVGWEPGAADRVPVKVHIHYMVGNHDWFYYRVGADYNGLRKKVCEAMGLSNDPDVPFLMIQMKAPQSQKSSLITKCLHAMVTSMTRSTINRTKDAMLHLWVMRSSLNC